MYPPVHKKNTEVNGPVIQQELNLLENNANIMINKRRTYNRSTVMQ